ncbi:MAG: two-component sensor histidine kinase [Parachlamydia sp.]|nr:two-component sensor histidine kinase [Parachlamydia sp.]
MSLALPNQSHTEALLDLIGEGLLLFAPDGQIALTNKAAEQILEMKAAQLLDNQLGFSIREALAHSHAPATLDIPYHIEGGAQKELTIETRFLDRYLLLIIRDVTEAKKLQALAARHDRMKELGDMVATVAHEIRNPLGGIRGFATLLHRDLSGQPQLQEMAQHIIDGADHLSQFVTHVLNYSRPAQAHFEPVDLNALMEELRISVEADSSLDAGIQLTFTPYSSPVIAPVDSQLLQSALLNLVVNAIQAMPQGGKLRLAVRQQGERAQLTVADTGEGISPENISKLFSPFFTTRPTGNGFGLAEVKKIVLAHGGTIDVQSELNRGTTFTLNLPLNRGQL